MPQPSSSGAFLLPPTTVKRPSSSASHGRPSSANPRGMKHLALSSEPSAASSSTSSSSSQVQMRQRPHTASAHRRPQTLFKMSAPSAKPRPNQMQTRRPKSATFSERSNHPGSANQAPLLGTYAGGTSPLPKNLYNHKRVVPRHSSPHLLISGTSQKPPPSTSTRVMNVATKSDNPVNNNHRYTTNTVITARAYKTAETQPSNFSSTPSQPLSQPPEAAAQGLLAWGSNESGQCALPPTSSPLNLNVSNVLETPACGVVQADSAGALTVVVDANGILRATGFVEQRLWDNSKSGEASQRLTLSGRDAYWGLKAIKATAPMRVCQASVGSGGRVFIVCESGEGFVFRIFSIGMTEEISRDTCGRMRPVKVPQSASCDGGSSAPPPRLITCSMCGTRAEAVDTDGRVLLYYEMGDALAGPSKLRHIFCRFKVVSVACAPRHTVVSTTAGVVMTRGDAGRGR